MRYLLSIKRRAERAGQKSSKFMVQVEIKKKFWKRHRVQGKKVPG
jgi:hypothetical protein